MSLQVVVISGHPDLEKSNANKLILEQLEERLERVDIRRLDQLYPDYRIDIEQEQAALLDAEVIVLQFPFYWYSVPGLMKVWIDEVLAYNFAYGSRGDKLKGKNFVISTTVGGSEEAYDPLGFNHFTIEQLVRPLQQTAYLTGMTYLPPVYTHGMVYIPGVYNTLEDVVEKAAGHANRLIDRIEHVLTSPEPAMRNFIKRWFATFDELPESDQFFLSHLSPGVVWSMPEGTFHGHAGFKDWYRLVRSEFKPGCTHQIEQVKIEVHATHLIARVQVRLTAELYEGGSVNLLVNERWVVARGDDNRFLIEEYQVTPA
tara:strand:- start:15687 stop:16631 length:945 start_codon:yes stop_codon:yes gene_type:complete